MNCIEKRSTRKFNLGAGLIEKFGMRYEPEEGIVEAKQQLTDALLVMKMSQKDGVATQIFPFLFIGSIGCAYNAEELNKNNITHIVCATSKAKEKFPQSIKYHRINIEDTLQEDITPVLMPFIKFVDSVRLSNENNRILVHCFQGRSRASSLCVAYMIYCTLRGQNGRRQVNQDEMSNLFCSSLDVIRARRPLVCPNSSFRRQVIAFFLEDKNYTKNDGLLFSDGDSDSVDT